MGMFTYVEDEEKNLWQSKFGNDDLDTYRIGDKVPVKYSRTPLDGSFIDGVYDAVPDGTNDSNEDRWVIIKDGKIAGIEKKEKYWDDEHYDYMHYKYNILLPDLTIWSDKEWAEYARNNAMSSHESTIHSGSLYGKSKEEIAEMMGKSMADLVRNRLSEPSIGRKILCPENH